MRRQKAVSRAVSRRVSLKAKARPSTRTARPTMVTSRPAAATVRALTRTPWAISLNIRATGRMTRARAKASLPSPMAIVMLALLVVAWCDSLPTTQFPFAEYASLNLLPSLARRLRQAFPRKRHGGGGQVDGWHPRVQGDHHGRERRGDGAGGGGPGDWRA